MNSSTTKKTNRPISIQTGSRQELFFLSVACMTGILTAILVTMAPPGVDDLLFLLPAKGSEPGAELAGMMTEEISRIWTSQTGRLGNFIAMPFLYLMPKWIFGILTGGIVTLLITLSCRLTGARYGSIISWLIYLTLILAYPWYDFLTMVTYAVNYIWAAAAATGAIVCYINIDRYSRLGCVACYLLMFVAGWMHEGFGAPMTAGLTLWLIIRHAHISLRHVAAWASAAAGTCMTALSPTFWSRSGHQTSLLTKYTYSELLMNIGPALLFLIALIISVIWIISSAREWKHILLRGRAVMLYVATLAATAIYLKYYTGPRTAAPAILYSMLACGYILNAAIRRKIPEWLQWTIGILAGGFTLVHLAYSCRLQQAITKEYEEVTALYEASDDGTFHYDLTYPKADLSLFKTTVRQLHERVPKEFLRIYYNPEHKMVILPAEMKGFTPEKARKSDLTPGAMVYNGMIIVPDSTDTESFQRIHILTEDGRYLPSRFRIDRFSCPGKGEFKIITPHIKVLDRNIMVKDVNLHDDSR